MTRRELLRRSAGEAGFSIIEVAVVVTVAAILTATSVLVFGKARARYQIRGRAESLAFQIERARSQAIKLNQTLTLGFSSENTIFGLTCSACSEARDELPALTLPAGVTLSAYPTITIKGNGTISSTTTSVTLNDNQGRQVTLAISNSGRVSVGDVVESAY
ncbi:MAG TPA: GspH/FimT family protein [Blastocatellia bacterium]|nr:GspH/FimT family protein [Blastocatellia bacterium]